MTTETQTQTQKPEEMTLPELEAYRDSLVERLDIGAVRIEEGRAAGKDTEAWELCWIQLIQHYGAICDKIRKLQAKVS